MIVPSDPQGNPREDVGKQVCFANPEDPMGKLFGGVTEDLTSAQVLRLSETFAEVEAQYGLPMPSINDLVRVRVPFTYGHRDYIGVYLGAAEDMDLFSPFYCEVDITDNAGFMRAYGTTTGEE